MVTKLGKYLKRLRLDHNEILLSMSKRIGISPAYLSAIENGKRKVPEGFTAKIYKEYSLDESQYQELNAAEEASRKSITVNLDETSGQQRDTALAFARKFKECDDETLAKIKEMLSKERGGRE